MDEPKFFQIQREFTRYLRDPDHAPIPREVKPEQIAIYSRAVIANIETFMGDNFPRVKEVLDSEHWSEMVRDYFIRHESKTSLFVDLSGEFLIYLDELRDSPEDPAFLYELAHFEHLENVVSTDEYWIAPDSTIRQDKVISAVPVLNPTTQLVRYAFPVHVIDADNQPALAPVTPTFIVAFRDRANQFGFMNVNLATARIVELLLDETPRTGREVLEKVSVELQSVDIDAVIRAGLQILNRLVERDVITGAKLERCC
jgi:hypothetical protein